MRVVPWLLLLVALAAGAWLVLDRAPEPDWEEASLEAVEGGEAPTLSGGGAAGEDDEAVVVEILDPETFFRRVVGKSGEALRLAVAEDADRRLPARADVVRRLMALLQSLANGDRAQGALFQRLRGMGPEAIPLLQPYLEGSDARAREAVFYALGAWLRVDPTIRVPYLTPYLMAPETRERAVLVLQHGSPFDPRVRDILVERAPADFMAAWALMKMADPAFDDFLGLFETTDEAVLQRYYNLLHELDERGRARALGVLRKGLVHRNDRIAETALTVLRGLGPGAAPALAETRAILTSDRLDLTRLALQLVEGMGPAGADAVDDVLPWIEDSDEVVAGHAALALGAISRGQSRVRRALVRAMEEDASDAAGKALAAFGAEGLAEAMRMVEHGDEDARYTALWTLAKLGPDAAPAVHLLVPLVAQEDDVLLRQRAIGVAGFIGPKADAVVPVIMKALRSEVMPLVASDASASMARLGPRARRALRDGLRSKDAVTRLRSAEMLQAFHGSSQFALDELEPLLGSKDHMLRRNAFLAVRVAVVYPTHLREEHPALFDKDLHARLLPLFERMKNDEAADIRALAAQGQEFLQHLDAHIAAHKLTP